MSVRFAQFADDVTIQAIGSLFRKLNGPKWGVNLGLFPVQEKHALLISNAPVLVRKRILNQDNKSSSPGYRRSFICAGTHTWDFTPISNFPAARLLSQIGCEKDQWCFKFYIDSDITVYLPQFELARALFLHNGYMSRTAIESDCLAMEFDINLDKEKSAAVINVLPSSGYPLNLYFNIHARRLLAWVLIDPDARASYESICRYQKLYGTERNGYRHWDFQFDPPPLENVHFIVKGIFDKATKSLFVYELLGLQNISANVPETVFIHHPKFKESKQGKAGRSVYSKTSFSEFDVYDDVDAKSDNDHFLLSSSGISLGFSQQFKTVRATNKKQTSSAGKECGEDSDAVSVDVSTDEPIASGGVSCADWDIVADETDDVDDAYISKFECFHKMLDYLDAEFECEVLSRELRKLPALPRCKKYLLADGTPRHMAVVNIKLNKRCFYLLEIDVSDSIPPLSTQLLCFGYSDFQDGELDKVVKGVVRNSIHWPTGLLYKLCRNHGGYKGIPHPKTKASDNGVLESDSVAHWAARIHARMKGLL